MVYMKRLVYAELVVHVTVSSTYTSLLVACVELLHTNYCTHIIVFAVERAVGFFNSASTQFSCKAVSIEALFDVYRGVGMYTARF